MNLKDLFALTHTNRGAITAEKIYATGRLTSHFFTFGSSNGFENYQLNLANMFIRMNSGIPPEEAFKASFDISYDELQAQINKYKRKRRFQVVQMTAPEVKADVEVQKLSEQQAAAELAFLASQLSQNEVAQDLLDDLDSVSSDLGLAIAAFNSTSNENEQAIELAVSAAAEASDFRSHNMLARAFVALAKQTKEQKNNAQDPKIFADLKALEKQLEESAVKHLTRSMELKPSYYALTSLADIYWENDEKQKAVDLAVQVYNLAPSTTSANLFVGKYMAKVGNKEYAEHFLGNVINWAHSESIRRSAEELLKALNTK